MATTKISVTIDDVDLAWLRQRAKRLHGGNLSAAVADVTQLARKQDALNAWLDREGIPEPTPEQIAEIRAEWRPLPRARSKRKRSA